MKKYLFLMLLFIPAMLNAQAWRDGRWMNNSSIGGNKLVEQTQYMWLPVTMDSSANGATAALGTLYANGGWGLDATYAPRDTVKTTAGTIAIRSLGFLSDSTTANDQKAYVTFVCPDDYKTDSMELYLYWYHSDAAATDYIKWYGAVNAVASGEAIFAAGTAMDGVQTVCGTRYCLNITNLDPEPANETITAGDLVTVMLATDNLNTGYKNPPSGAYAWLMGVKVTWEAKEN